MQQTQKQERDRAYYAANREAISTKRRAKYRADPGIVKAKVRAYYKSRPDKITEYREANRERRNAQRREWGKANSDRLRELDKARDPEAMRISARAYYAAHAEERRVKSQEWRAANPLVVKESQKRYRAENAAKLYDKNAKRRARLKGATVEDVDRRVVFDLHGGVCGICRESVLFDAMTIDHVIPLVAGGQHRYSNVQPAHLSCNSRKGARIQINI